MKVRNPEIEKNKRMLHQLKIVTKALHEANKNLNNMLKNYNQNAFFNAQSQFNKPKKYHPARQHFPGTRGHALLGMVHPVTRGNYLFAQVHK
jgi:hypothetical protein